MIELLIVDDHPLVIDGVKTMLKDVDDFRIVGACTNAKDALAFLLDHHADVILLDISLPDMDGLRLCEEIRRSTKTTKIIGLTSANEAGIITGLLQRGGNGYLLKNMERKELIDAIHSVMSGKLYLSKDANDKVLEQFQNIHSALDDLPVLTRREKEILQLLNDGLNGPQIADKLFLSTHTVETHRKNLLQKFKVSGTQLLLNKAREHRLLK